MRTQPINLCHSFSYASAVQNNVAGHVGALFGKALLPVLATKTARHVLPVLPQSAALPPAPVINTHPCMMLLTIGNACIHQCRHLLFHTCGNNIIFLRTQPIAHSTNIKVWLGVNEAVIDQVMHTVMHAIPSAEFGRITHETI